jgi:plasmid replication initiation protein
METELVIIQPNAVTNARYDYSQLQKDFMLYYIEAMNKHMTKEKELSRDLFGNMQIEMELKDICKSNNHAKMLAAIRDLMKKPISYYYNRDDGTYDVHTTLIASLIHKRNTGMIYIKTTEESLPVVRWLGEGFTTFNRNIALSLSSVYAKRLYELCCRWKDKGFCRMKLDEFRVMMCVEDKYVKISDLKANVLDIGEKFLKEGADLNFTYTLRKENGSKAFNWLELNIHSQIESGKTGEWYQSLYNNLYQIYRNSRAIEICDYITTNKELKKANERFARLMKDIDTGRIKPHGILAYVNSVLGNEFDVPDAITGRGMEKRKKQGKAELLFKKAAAKKAAAMAKKDKKKAAKIKVDLIPDLFNEEMTKSGDSESLRDIINKRLK